MALWTLEALVTSCAETERDAGRVTCVPESEQAEHVSKPLDLYLGKATEAE